MQSEKSVAVKSNAFFKDSLVGCCVSHSGSEKYAVGASLEEALKNAMSALGIMDLSECEYRSVDDFPLDHKKFHFYPLNGFDYYLNKNTVFASQILSSIEQGETDSVVSIVNHVYKCSIEINAFEIIIKQYA